MLMWTICVFSVLFICRFAFRKPIKMPDINPILYGVIGKRISELRKYNNDNQQQLADKIKLKRSSISNIESGRQQISLHLLYRISQVYNTEIYSLLPTVSEVASKVSLSLDNVTEVLKQNDVGLITEQQILKLLQ